MENFHDWTLLSLDFDWAAACVSIRICGPGSVDRKLVAEDVSQLLVPRHLPWGRSVSINGVQVADVSDRGCNSMEIEMQSGDIIRIEAARFKSVEV